MTLPRKPNAPRTNAFYAATEENATMSTTTEQPNTTYYFDYRNGRKRRKPMRAYSADPVQRKRQLEEHPREGVLTVATKALGYHMIPAPPAG